MTTDDPVAQILEPDEAIELVANARAQRIILTDRRVAVADDDRVALHVPYRALRRIEFDIERERPATLVIVPESPHIEPQVLVVRPEDYADVARVLVAIGRRLLE